MAISLMRLPRLTGLNADLSELAWIPVGDVLMGLDVRHPIGSTSHHIGFRCIDRVIGT